MPDFSQFPLHAAIGTLLGTVSLFAVVLRSPRLMRNDYPPVLKEVIPPLTPEEKRTAWLLGMPFFIILLFFPFVVTMLFATRGPQPPAFLYLFLYAAGIAFVFNVWDWLVLDWLLFCTITPRWVIVPGTEGNPGYKDYAFHFRGFLIGTLFSAIIGLISAGVVALLL